MTVMTINKALAPVLTDAIYGERVDMANKSVVVVDEEAAQELAKIMRERAVFLVEAQMYDEAQTLLEQITGLLYDHR